MSVRTAVLSDICDINPRAPKSIADNEVVSFLPMSAVSEGGFVEYEEERQFAAVKKGYTYFERGDILVAKITPCFENGKATGTDDLKHGVGFGSTEFHVLRPSPDLDRRYLFYLLWNERFRQSAAKGMTGSAGQKRVPADLLKRLEIPLPPLDEQQRIAAILDKADSLRNKRKQAIALLDSLTQSIFLEMFGDPISNSHSFPVRALEEIVAADRKVTYGILKPGPDIEEGVPYIRVVDIQDGNVLPGQLRRTSFEIAKQYQRSRLHSGDLLISIRGHVGRMAIVPNECNGANITQDTARLAIEGANTEFVMALLATSGAQQWMSQRTKGIAVRGINLGDLKKFPVILPSAALQEEFAKISRSVRSLASAKRWHSELAEDAFQSLQHRAFAGEL